MGWRYLSALLFIIINIIIIIIIIIIVLVFTVVPICLFVQKSASDVWLLSSSLVQKPS